MSRRNLTILSLVLSGLVLAAGVRIRQLHGELQRTRAALQATEERLDAAQRQQLLQATRQLPAAGSGQAAGTTPSRRSTARGASGTRAGPPDQAPDGGSTSPRATRRAAVRERLQQASAQLPEDFFLDKLFDVVDELADEEGWSDTTYEEVAVTFETTADNLRSIALDVQAGQLSRSQAREELLTERDALIDDLDLLIAPEGTERLRDMVRQQLAEKISTRRQRTQP